MARQLFRLPPQALILGLGFLVLVATSAASLWFVERVQDQAARVLHTIEVDAAVVELQLELRRAQASQRGYLLTGFEIERERFRAAVAAVPEVLERLRRLVADNPRQQETLAQLEQVVAERVATLRAAITAADAGLRDDAIASVTAVIQDEESAKRVVELADLMKAEESRLLAERSAALSESRFWVTLIGIVGVLLVVLLAALSILMVRRATARLQAASRALASANARLEERVAARTAALQEANEEIQHFAYIVSHDLRSPLVNIMGFTSELEALRDALIDEAPAAGRGEGTAPGDAAERRDEVRREFDEALAFIKSSTAKMDRLINAILQLSRAGRRQFDPQPVDLDQTMRMIGQSLAHQLQEKDATLEIAPLPSVVTDRLAVEQIFSNLLDNAVKYLRRGVPGRIEVSAVEKPSIVAIRIADNGRGIDPKDRERVFELFRRSGVQDVAGEGIGLAHVRMLLRRIGGRISLESEPGRGSAFTIILPRVLSSET